MSVSSLLSSNEMKKKLSRCYNEIHKDLYGVGVTQMKIEAVDDMMIMFLVKHQRVVALKALEAHYPELKQSVDSALHQEFKLRFQNKLSDEMELSVKGMLRDYDPASEWACTLVITE